MVVGVLHESEQRAGDHAVGVQTLAAQLPGERSDPQFHRGVAHLGGDALGDHGVRVRLGSGGAHDRCADHVDVLAEDFRKLVDGLLDGDLFAARAAVKLLAGDRPVRFDLALVDDQVVAVNACRQDPAL